MFVISEAISFTKPPIKNKN